MHISRLRVSNFKSFRNEIEVNFDDFKGLWRLHGQIGSGKTTLGEAIIFGLYGSVRDKNNKDLITWGQKHGLVELWCTSHEKNIYIKREINYYGQSPMYVEVDGEPIVFSNKRNAQQQLEQEYLDASRSVMELICIISFNNFKSLSTLNTKDTKMFLDNVLGFSVVTDYADRCKEMISDLGSQISNLQGQRDVLNKQLERMERQSEYKAAQEDIEQQEKLIHETTLELNRKKDEYKQAITPLESDRLQFIKHQSAVLAMGKAKKKEIEFIQKGICPTCHQPIPQDTLQAKIQEREELLEQYTGINAHITQINAHIQEISSKMDKCIAELSERVKSQENELTRLRMCLQQKRYSEQEQQAIRNSIAEIQEKETKLKCDHEAYQEILRILTQDVRQEILRGFIPQINRKINELAAYMSLPYTPEFDDQFKCTIHTRTLQEIPISSLSTGQLKIVDMIIILAVLQSVVGSVGSNVIFLDELFSNLDPSTRNSLISVLRNTLDEDVCCFIVSHQDLDTDQFDGSIHMRINQADDGVRYTVMTCNKVSVGAENFQADN